MNTLEIPVTCFITFNSLTVLSSELNKYYSFHFANEETKTVKIFSTYPNHLRKSQNFLSNILSTVKLQNIVSLQNKINHKQHDLLAYCQNQQAECEPTIHSITTKIEQSDPHPIYPAIPDSRSPFGHK